MSMGFVKSAYIKEISGGNKMFKKLKDKKGFTLVELIVVLVILAILAALLVPALTGYIDKANQEKVIAECRSVVVAAQTTASEYYGLNKSLKQADADYATNSKNALDQIATLAEVPTTSTTTGSVTTTTTNWHYEIEIGTVNGENNVVTSVKFDDGNASVTYTKNAKTGAGEFSTVGESDSNFTTNTIEQK